MKKFGLAFCLIIALSANAASKKPLSLTDIMQFRQISSPTLSENGRWLGYTATPDRGDSAAVLMHTDGQGGYRWENASHPVASGDGQWAYATLEPSLLAKEQAAQNKKSKKLENGLMLINLVDNKIQQFKSTAKADFSADSRWFTKLHTSSYGDKKSKTDKAPEKNSGKKNKHKTGTLTLHDLKGGQLVTIEHVLGFKFSPDSRYLVVSIFDEANNTGSLQYRDLKNDITKVNNIKSAKGEQSLIQQWDESGERMAFVWSSVDKSKKRNNKVILWHPAKDKTTQIRKVKKGWYIPEESKLHWTKNNSRLFLGLKPYVKQKQGVSPDIENKGDLFNIEKLLAKKELDIWHTDDPRIKTNEITTWSKQQKKMQLAVYHIAKRKLVQINDEEFESSVPTEHPEFILASGNKRYQKARTWGESNRDYAVVNLKTGKRKIIARKLNTRARPSLSPSGETVVYYKDEAYYQYNTQTRKTKLLASKDSNKWGNEEFDKPDVKPGYGIAGWLNDADGVLLYDKYDIWMYPVKGGEPVCLTAGKGRKGKNIFRIIKTKDGAPYYSEGDVLLLSVYNDHNKQHGFARLNIKDRSHKIIMQGEKHYRFVTKAKKADAIIYTREDYREFPDIWFADADLNNATKLTDENPQINDYAWSQKPELLEWKGLDGDVYQGFLIKPANYNHKKHYPVVFYFYERYSQRLHDFNAMKINHRPNFQYFADNGYAVFLPDVHFKNGHPGQSFYNSLIPAGQMLIDKGITKAGLLGLQGHSWGGYGAAYLATRTNMFGAIVSGAPVTNMTSAYSGIRLESGVTRQHQYEKGQSRIGKTLWDKGGLDLYLENSPVFFADKVKTPMLMVFGDKDGAVPWQQGVDMYMALRRLNKPTWLLQYHGEPHHLKKYPNKVDYTIKMMQFFDHFLKGEKAPEWITKGEPYQGKD